MDAMARTTGATEPTPVHRQVGRGAGQVVAMTGKTWAAVGAVSLGVLYVGGRWWTVDLLQPPGNIARRSWIHPAEPPRSTRTGRVRRSPDVRPRRRALVAPRSRVSLRNLANGVANQGVVRHRETAVVRKVRHALSERVQFGCCGRPDRGGDRRAHLLSSVAIDAGQSCTARRKRLGHRKCA